MPHRRPERNPFAAVELVGDTAVVPSPPPLWALEAALAIDSPALDLMLAIVARHGGFRPLLEVAYRRG